MALLDMANPFRAVRCERVFAPIRLAFGANAEPEDDGPIAQVMMVIEAWWARSV